MTNAYLKCFFCATILSSNVSSQNLVLNPSFENHILCPTQEDQLSNVNDWFNPSKSSPDYYNSCNGDSISNKTIVGVPYNFNGYKLAQNGSAYIGVALCSSDPLYREYIQTKLKHKFLAGKTYKFSFWVSLADSSNYKINGLSICFSENKNLGTKNVRDGSIILSTNNANSVWCKLKEQTNYKHWVEITGIYEAQKQEEYLTIGIFKEDNKKLRKKKIKKAKKAHLGYGYYYIDFIEVIESD